MKYKISLTSANPKKGPLFASTVMGLILLFSHDLFAQSTGSLIGTVREEGTGQGLPGVRINVAGRSASTDRSGYFEVPNVPSGSQTVTALYLGFDPVTREVAIDAGSTASIAIAMGTEVVELEEFAVQGIMAGQARALNQQRAADSIVSILSADAVGKLPDDNVAEAMQRVAGLHITRSEGDGRYVFIRGVFPNLNSTMIDGGRVAAPEADDRRVALDVIPADLIGQVTVHKGLTPDIDGDSIGGVIDIQTASPFDNERRRAGASVEYGQNSQGNGDVYKGAFHYSDLLGRDNKWGISFSGSYLEDNKFNYRIETEDWTDVNGNPAPEELRYFIKDIVRERYGFGGNLEFRPDDKSRFYAGITYSWWGDQEDQQRQRWLDLQESLPPDTQNDQFTGVSPDSTVRKELRLFEVNQEIWTAKIGAEHDYERFTIDYMTSYSYASEDTPTRDEWRFNFGGVAAAYDFSDPFFPEVRTTGGSDLFEPSNYEFNRYIDRNEWVSETVWAFQANIKYDFNLGEENAGYLKTGVKYTTKDKIKRDFRFTYRDIGLSDPTLSDFVDELNAPVDLKKVVYEYGPTQSKSDTLQFLDANFSNFGVPEFDDTDRFDVNEDIFAAYGMASIDFGKLNILGGVRYERTRGEYMGSEGLRELLVNLGFGDYNTLNKKTFEQWLPSVHATYRATENLVFRASYSQSYGRPIYNHLTGFLIIDDVAETIRGSNPFLEPYESFNIDFSVEWYLQNLGVVSGSFFYKEVDGYIYIQVGRVTGDEFDFESFSTQEIIDRTGYTITNPVNANTAKITGFELSFQKQFTGLPAPLDGLGILANYTIVDSEVDVFSGNNLENVRTVPFFGQADEVYNLQFFYSKGKIDGRVSFNHRDKFLADELGDFGPSSDFADTYEGDSDWWDFKITYHLNDHWRIFAQVLNLGDDLTSEQYTAQNPARLRENDHYGRSWRIGFGWEL